MEIRDKNITMLKPEDFTYFSTYLIADEAQKRGIKVSKFFLEGPLARKSTMQLKYKRHKEIIVGQRTSKTDVIAYWIQQNKQLAKKLFAANGINVAKSKVFNYKSTEKILDFCKKIGYPVVIKPLRGIQGKSVFLGIDSDKKVLKTLKEFKKSKFKTILVEKEFHGEEYRIFATKDKFVAAIHRVPANVVGDGVHSIKELIRLKNQDPRRGEGHTKSLVKIRVDSVVKEYLKKQKLRLSSVPKKDETIYLRTNSNISTGGDSYDVTNQLNPKVKRLAPKIIRAIPGLAYAGIDYLTHDITAEPNSRNYIVIEVNDSPMISMHHIPYVGKERNAAGVIIDQIFPETKKVKKKK